MVRGAHLQIDGSDCIWLLSPDGPPGVQQPEAVQQRGQPEGGGPEETGFRTRQLRRDLQQPARRHQGTRSAASAHADCSDARRVRNFAHYFSFSSNQVVYFCLLCLSTVLQRLDRNPAQVPEQMQRHRFCSQDRAR